MENVFLKAFEGTNSRVPVWFMRQAGRYLPEYRALKATRTLNEMFRDPDTAAEITMQPIRLMGVDAAILFADILTLPSGLGFDVDFIDGKGPVIANRIERPFDAKRIGTLSGLNYVGETIKRVNSQLPAHIPLIGFAGSPYTVLSYICANYKRCMTESPAVFHELMDRLTNETISYLRIQKDAGIKAFQLFDTWAGELRASDYQTFVLPYIQRIFQAIDLPSIYYLKNCAHLMPLMLQSKAKGVSVCELVTLGENAQLNKFDGLVQGNFFNGLLYASDDIIVKETHKILTAAKANHRRYIFNLSHGIFPDVDPLKIKLIVSILQKFKWQ